jgi:hypothetical protein
MGYVRLLQAGRYDVLAIRCSARPEATEMRTRYRRRGSSAACVVSSGCGFAPAEADVVIGAGRGISSCGSSLSGTGR